MWEWRYRNEAKVILRKERPDNSKLDNFSENSIWHFLLISPWWYSYKFIDVWRLINMCTLPLCCSSDNHKCEWKIINTEKTQRKKEKKKLHFEISFLNFLRNITFTTLPIFQNFIIFLSTLRPWTMQDVLFSSAD